MDRKINFHVKFGSRLTSPEVCTSKKAQIRFPSPTDVGDKEPPAPTKNRRLRLLRGLQVCGVFFLQMTVSILFSFKKQVGGTTFCSFVCLLRLVDGRMRAHRPNASFSGVWSTVCGRFSRGLPPPRPPATMA